MRYQNTHVPARWKEPGENLTSGAPFDIKEPLRRRCNSRENERSKRGLGGVPAHARSACVGTGYFQ